MKAIYLRDGAWSNYGALIVNGVKTIETRNKNTLRSLVGERVAIAWSNGRKHRKQNWEVIGYVTISGNSFCDGKDFDEFFFQHFVPVGDEFYPKDGKGKWFYYLADAEACDPYPLPSSVIRHGRSWCEWEVA